MGFGPLQPARIVFSDGEPPYAPDFDDIYHARAGALEQAQHVFLRGNRLPERWQRQPRFTILETGFGLGNNFLAAWQAWRDAPARSERLEFISIEKHPPRREDLARAHAAAPDALRPLAEALLAAWPPLTPDLHTLAFDAGRVRLRLVFADIADALPELIAQVDAFFLDGFAPARNPAMWDRHRLRQLARLAAPGATAATWSVARELRDGLSSAGFVVERAPGFGGKRDMTIGRFAPRHPASPPPGRRASSALQVAVIGAGLAGGGVARALAAEGLSVAVFEADAAPAQQTSGNPAGLFHGIVHRDDGPHARWLRAAALRMQQLLAPLIADGQVRGAFGLLRGERDGDAAAMQALLDEDAWPAEWVRIARANGAPAWFYPGGGWAAPVDLVAHWLATPGIALQLGMRIERLQRAGDQWQLLGSDDRIIATVDAVVLANAADATRLLGDPGWPLESVRGQLSIVRGAPADLLPQPVADGGYALQLPDGRVLCGATSQAGDDDPRVRAADHDDNLATLQRLSGWTAPDDCWIEGRVGWRLQTQDRLPLLGPVPIEHASSPLPNQARLIERRPGLYVATAYGSRGLTHAALAGEVLAAWITGAPMPVPARLLDAVDCARYLARLSRTSA
ncbi:FAD-dependent 5-carboxymethylaminomethyl-2-thiouridine(34) oxidoreductase MnmC [Aquincola sp. S2]|uniref:tRNA 5-methylaminomethyl-2-thiouridine biosynthesis bifunctional protein MnmC n=1 Tax=Pseudaquabacterium terrae TaxID=2732868 RepID=A0ABX2EN25_9BURK|nr:FAD-dependent 5-carboxymethylaminomethyl-2-thiouridine(34) oxidoreductase MnmC [Aquabacterium terrae]NRF69973.1 FAD-dependent 5-carboxymethylaminomethyl-2-thiouridine(34) oxidoreductase MnmC [Aquabacterium terrae]